MGGANGGGQSRHRPCAQRLTGNPRIPSFVSLRREACANVRGHVRNTSSHPGSHRRSVHAECFGGIACRCLCRLGCRGSVFHGACTTHGRTGGDCVQHGIDGALPGVELGASRVGIDVVARLAIGFGPAVWPCWNARRAGLFAASHQTPGSNFCRTGTCFEKCRRAHGGETTAVTNYSPA